MVVDEGVEDGAAVSVEGVFVVVGVVHSNEEKDDKHKHTTMWLSFKICLQTVLIMLSVYVIRQIVKTIPFIFDGYNGYDHQRLLELNGAVILAFVLITLQSNYGYDMQLLASRLQTNWSSTSPKVYRRAKCTECSQ